MIITVLGLNDKKLFDYLCKRNIDVDYHTFLRTDNPLRLGLYNDIANNDFYFSKILVEKILETNKDFYHETNKYYDNMAHTVIYIRTTENANGIEKKKINSQPDFHILKLSDSKTWNQQNVDKVTPLELLTELDFQLYSKILLDKPA